MKEVEALKIRATTRTSIHTARNLAEEQFPEMKQKSQNQPPQPNPNARRRSTYAETTRRNLSSQQKNEQRRPQRNNRREVSNHKFIKQVISTLLPEILVPLIKILIEVTTIPGESQGKIERVNEVVTEAIKKSCDSLDHQDGYTTEEDDNDYEPSSTEPEESDSSESEGFSDSDLENQEITSQHRQERPMRIPRQAPQDQETERSQQSRGRPRANTM